MAHAPAKWLEHNVYGPSLKAYFAMTNDAETENPSGAAKIAASLAGTPQDVAATVMRALESKNPKARYPVTAMATMDASIGANYTDSTVGQDADSGFRSLNPCRTSRQAQHKYQWERFMKAQNVTAVRQYREKRLCCLPGSVVRVSLSLQAILLFGPFRASENPVPPINPVATRGRRTGLSLFVGARKPGTGFSCC